MESFAEVPEIITEKKMDMLNHQNNKNLTPTCQKTNAKIKRQTISSGKILQ